MGCCGYYWVFPPNRGKTGFSCASEISHPCPAQQRLQDNSLGLAGAPFRTLRGPALASQENNLQLVLCIIHAPALGISSCRRSGRGWEDAPVPAVGAGCAGAGTGAPLGLYTLRRGGVANFFGAGTGIGFGTGAVPAPACRMGVSTQYCTSTQLITQTKQSHLPAQTDIPRALRRQQQRSVLVCAHIDESNAFNLRVTGSEGQQT